MFLDSFGSQQNSREPVAFIASLTSIGTVLLMMLAVSMVIYQVIKRKRRRALNNIRARIDNIASLHTATVTMDITDPAEDIQLDQSYAYNFMKSPIGKRRSDEYDDVMVCHKEKFEEQKTEHKRLM